MQASAYGALAVAFSAYWMNSHHNITISGALCAIPWTLLCFERWIDRPTARSSLYMSIMVSLLIFSGYPQAFHGTVIYMGLSLIPNLFYIGSVKDIYISLKQHLLTAILAIAVCIGLSSVQWLPLLELASLSHRSGGADILFRVPYWIYLRGFLFSISHPHPKIPIFATVGSIYICYLASLALIFKPHRRIIGHAIASLFLLVLGMEYSTPMFSRLLEFNLVPGLSYFRIVHLYMGISIIGFGLMGSFAVTQFQKRLPSDPNRAKNPRILIAMPTILFIGWVALLLRHKCEDASIGTYSSFLMIYFVLVLMIFIGKTEKLGHAVLILIVFEIFAVKIPFSSFADQRMLEQPWIFRFAQEDIRQNGFKLFNMSSWGSIVFVPRLSPSLESAARKVFKSATGSSNVLWDIPSIDGCFALPLARRRLIQPTIEAEVSGQYESPPGARLIDYLGIKYISANKIYRKEGVVPLVADDIILLENQYAFPQIQAYTRYEMAGSPEDALHRLKRSTHATLVIEMPADHDAESAALPESAAFNDSQAITIRSAKQRNVKYEVDLDVAQPAWLFVADANYPGWKASIDGKPTTIYSAQVLGKAILVPQGRHQVVFKFRPPSVLIGLSFSLITILSLIIIGFRGFRLKQRRMLNTKLV